jgi:Sec-independent protein translocase protein TatA
MDAAWIAIIVSVVVGLINLFVLGMGGIWKIAELKAALVQAIFETQTDVSSKLDTAIREFGETISAIRQHVMSGDAALQQEINEMALWNRDNFIQKNSVTELREAIDHTKETLEARLIRIEGEIRRHTGAPK